jgi:hypothetical protein
VHVVSGLEPGDLLIVGEIEGLAKGDHIRYDLEQQAAGEQQTAALVGDDTPSTGAPETVGRNE